MVSATILLVCGAAAIGLLVVFWRFTASKFVGMAAISPDGFGPADTWSISSLVSSEYIEIFYNRQRRHSRLGYLSPALFAENFSKQPLAA